MKKKTVSELSEEIKAAQRSLATLRNDIAIIVRDVLTQILRDHELRGLNRQ